MAEMFNILRNDNVFITSRAMSKHKHYPVGDNRRVDWTKLKSRTHDFGLGLVQRVSTARSHPYLLARVSRFARCINLAKRVKTFKTLRFLVASLTKFIICMCIVSIINDNYTEQTYKVVGTKLEIAYNISPMT